MTTTRPLGRSARVRDADLIGLGVRSGEEDGVEDKQAASRTNSVEDKQAGFRGAGANRCRSPTDRIARVNAREM
jgi:hypothetical protein